MVQTQLHRLWPRSHPCLRGAAAVAGAGRRDRRRRSQPTARRRTAARMLDAWHAHLVLLLRNQTCPKTTRCGSPRRFGPPAKIHTTQFVRTHPAVMLISNIREDGKLIGALPDGEMHFHTDQCYQERPAMASMLYAIEVPSEGGNTLFANGYKAYETLPEDIKRRLDGRRALNAYDYDSAAAQARHRRSPKACRLRPSGRAHASRDRAQGALCQPTDDVAHRGPAARTRARSSSDSCSITRSSREFVYEHVWRPGDCPDVGQPLHAARAHRFQRRRAPPDAARDHPGRKAGVIRRSRAGGSR